MFTDSSGNPKKQKGRGLSVKLMVLVQPPPTAQEKESDQIVHHLVEKLYQDPAQPEIIRS